MEFFNDFYKYDKYIEAPEEGSKEWIEEREYVERQGNKYLNHLKAIKKYLPKAFLESYFDYTQFQDWDLTELVFNHDIDDHPYIIMDLTHPNINKVITLKYIDVKSFFTNLGEDYFEGCSHGKFGMIGVNEFILHGKILSHEIYFYSQESLKIYFRKLEFSVTDKA